LKRIIKWFQNRKEVKRKELELIENFKPSKPLTWWIDDLSHRVCGLIDDPIYGLDKLQWPDYEKVYVAVDKREYDNIFNRLSEAIECLKDGCLVYDQHVPSGSSSFRSEAQCLIDEFTRKNNSSEHSVESEK